MSEISHLLFPCCIKPSNEVSLANSKRGFSSVTHHVLTALVVSIVIGAGAAVAAYFLAQGSILYAAIAGGGSSALLFMIGYAALRCIFARPQKKVQQEIRPIEHASSEESVQITYTTTKVSPATPPLVSKPKMPNLDFLKVRCFDFGKGHTQYHVPVARSDALDCSFIAAHSVHFLSICLVGVLNYIEIGNTSSLQCIHRQILNEGYKISHPKNGPFIAEEAVNPGQLDQYTEAFNRLDIPKEAIEIQCYMMKPEFRLKLNHELIAETREQFEQFFSAPEDAERLAYALVVVDGQTFSLTRLNQKYALLFDSHRSMFQVVDVQATLDHIFVNMLAGNGLNEGEILLYFGTVKRYLGAVKR